MSARLAWTVGLVAGLAAGFVTIEGGMPGWIPTAVIYAWAILSRPAFAALAGLLVGHGLMWMGLLGRVALTCSLPTCEAPGIGSWIAAGAVLLVVGVVVTIRALRTRPA